MQQQYVRSRKRLIVQKLVTRLFAKHTEFDWKISSLLTSRRRLMLGTWLGTERFSWQLTPSQQIVAACASIGVKVFKYMTGVSIVLPPTFLPFFFCCLTAFFLPCLIFPYVPLVFGDDQYSVLWYNQVLLWFLVLIPGTAYYIVMSVLGQYARYCLCTWYLMMSDYAVCGLYIYMPAVVCQCFLFFSEFVFFLYALPPALARGCSDCFAFTMQLAPCKCVLVHRYYNTACIHTEHHAAFIV